MKFLLRRSLLAIAMAVTTLTARAAANWTLTPGQTYDLIQNKSYLVSGTVNKIDKDFFFRDLDGSGSYRFLSLDGNYRVVLTSEGYLTAQSTASEWLWACGAWSSLCKEKAYEDGNDDWAAGNFMCLAQVRKGYYQLTFTAGTGNDANAYWVNWKLYTNNSWGETTVASRTHLASSLLELNASGNFNLQSGMNLTDGATYVLYVDATEGMDQLKVDLQQVYEVTDQASLEAAASIDWPNYFKFKGDVTEEMLDYITANHYTDQLFYWARVLDFSEATGMPATGIPDNFMTLGTDDANDGKAIENQQLYRVLLPNGLTTIGSFAFGCCTSLGVINLTKDLTTLGQGMLMYAYRLHALSVDNHEEQTHFTIHQNFDQLYNGGEALYEAEYEAAIQEGLKDVYLGNNLTVDSIGYLAFFQHRNLTSFKLGSNTTVGMLKTNAFTNCMALPGADIQAIIDNATEIWNAAFYSCHQLTSLTIPASVTMIDNAAFGDCPITAIHVTGATAPACPEYQSGWYSNAWAYFSEYAFSGIRNKTNGSDQHVRLNQMTLYFDGGTDATQWRYDAVENPTLVDSERLNEAGTADQAQGKAKYGEFRRLLTKQLYQANDYDVTGGQEHADVQLYRTMKENWNGICLPFSMTRKQVDETFGAGTEVAEFDRVAREANANGGNVLFFAAVRKDNPTDVVIEAGHPYIIMATDNYGSNSTLTPDNSPYGNRAFSSQFNTLYDEYIGVTSATGNNPETFFLVKDVTLPATSELPAIVETTHDGYTFTGNYNTIDNIAAENNVLYISNNLFKYRAQGSANKTTSRGYRSWFKVDPSAAGVGLAKSSTFSIDLTSTVNGISTVKRIACADNDRVYNLQGQYVGPAANLSLMPAGIYVVDGRKVVVK